MGRWKMLDNLRRSLSAPAALLAMLIGWLLPMPAAEIWTAYILVDHRAAALCCRRSPASFRAARAFRCAIICVRCAAISRSACLQSAFLITFLAHQAWLMVDAVVRTLFRLFIRRRRLLEWVTAAQTTEDSQFDTRGARRCRSRRALASPAVVAHRYSMPSGHEAGRSPCRSCFCGCCRRSSRAGRACRRPRPAICRSRRADALALAARRAAHLALLRNIRHRGRQHAAARQFSGGSRTGRRAPHLADQYRPVSPLDRRRARFRLAGDARTRWSGSKRHSRRWRSWSAFAAISTTGTIRATCARWSRNISPRWIAAILPAI